jgi:hypothetical protein
MRRHRVLIATVLLGIAAYMVHAGAQGFAPGLFTYLRLGSSLATKVSTGTGSPEAAVTGAIGDLFLRTDGGAATTLYVKESGSGNTGWIAPTTAASTTTETNKTLDAEATGNVLTLPFSLWIPAARCDNATATSPAWSFPTSNPGVPACVTGSNTQFGTMDFADGANTLSAQTHVMLPGDWTGTVGVKLKWFTSATTNAVVWQVATDCVADAETSDPAFNTASTVTDTAKGTTLQQNDAAIASLTVTGCAAGELMYLRVFRDPTNGSDTLAATAKLVGIELTYRRAI